MGASPRFAISLMLCLLAAGASLADSLPRRGFFGAQLSPIPAAEKNRSAEGVYIKAVLPDSSAKASGFEAGDILLALDGKTLTGREAVETAVVILGSRKPGDAIVVDYLRGAEQAERTLTLNAMPEEQDSDYSTRYSAVNVDGALHRVILTTPPGQGPFPSFFYIQGLGCSSVDWPFDADNPIRKLLAGLSREGFATLRVEKSGVGDSQGTPCPDIDFATELKAYEAACAWALTQPEAGPLFLFGHSMGGVFAPLVAQTQEVAGVMAFGTITSPLKDYFLENEVRQQTLREAPQSFIDSQRELMARFCDGFFGKRQSPGALLATNEAFKPFLAIRDASDAHFHGRHMQFWFQLDDLNILDVWKQAESPVLVLWGQCDVPASRGDHVTLAEALPGSTYIEIPNLGHGFDTAKDMAESMKNRSSGPFNPAIVDAVAAWMKGVLGG